MDLTSLDIFEAVAAELNVTRAAHALGRAQSNVTTRLQALEQQLGVALFLREGKRLSLTEQGTTFLGYSRRLRALADEARQALHPQVPAGTLRLGSMESTAAARLPNVLARLHGTWPELELNLTTGTSQGLLRQLADGELDCALVALVEEQEQAPLAQLAERGLRGEALIAEEMLVLVPQGHTAPSTQGLRLAGFAKGCTYRGLGQRWLEREGSVRVQEVGSYHNMLACVAAGHSACIVPRSLLALQPDLPVRVQATLGTVHTWLAWRAGYATAGLAALREAFSA
ncbi:MULTISPECIES: LysR substrate-binding domain-containing protein [unclassified Pseudomonas]|uniref:LysR substrate-binding domain-containing protein n=1 Tax=unclassified Pseudomonas TaxID=196821 RepID=UPI000BC84EB3|nr:MULTISPECIES: LysR substrate-binding domain-containing protein [unclassified Pseudomonas]PVZ20506.1 DNA-binding transcriptional LysR family regulator [Pseudomonas sp. URIL14HWK12:I12]PVZ27572.1 DNA-binding transcriptional LysR family regulator [Pseudomonas sp. URIL14HWK12:I10]PVZ38461.1 DNA-binding transcriptional LysR family regulator [Pseudomonas sp. URIL14HWK12:I11]SNZ03264.1 DNA-binding transcriptional regulator, LysR family [Pseudomonas sp. URIL14HWK12:I9]